MRPAVYFAALVWVCVRPFMPNFVCYLECCPRAGWEPAEWMVRVGRPLLNLRQINNYLLSHIRLLKGEQTTFREVFFSLGKKDQKESRTPREKLNPDNFLFSRDNPNMREYLALFHSEQIYWPSKNAACIPLSKACEEGYLSRFFSGQNRSKAWVNRSEWRRSTRAHRTKTPSRSQSQFGSKPLWTWTRGNTLIRS